MDFAKNAGNSLVGRADASDAQVEEALIKEVKDIGLDAEGRNIKFEVDSVKVSGKTNRYHEIFEASRPTLAHPDKIYPGQVLRIPAK